MSYTPQTSQVMDSIEKENSDPNVWRILTVEDDPTYQASLVYALEMHTVSEKPLEILTANSAAQAATIIANTPDIAVILLDVVMEDDDAGLRLVGTIREILGNNAVRIVLLTGQPGMAPRGDIMANYDIDDYWCKSEMSTEQLRSVITANIRTWHYISQLNNAKKGLQLLIDACQTLNNKRDLRSFSHAILEQISKLISGHSPAHIICLQHHSKTPLEQARMIASSGRFQRLTERCLSDMHDTVIYALVRKASMLHHHVFEGRLSVLYFNSHNIDQNEYITVVETDSPISEQYLHLIQVFSENVSTGFTNIALYNRLTELAYRDPLLKLHNRTWLLRELTRMSAYDRHQICMLLVDLDDFSDMAVTFGESFCIDVLKGLRERIQSLLPETISLCRIDRDTLAILLHNDSMPTQAEIIRDLCQPLSISNQEHTISATAALVPLRYFQQSTAEQMLQLAESTLDLARKENLNLLEFRPHIEQEIHQRYTLLSELRKALEDDQITILLQPKVRLDNGQIVGFEALARWTTESGQFIPPDQFIPLAEKAGLIEKLDHQVLAKVCKAAHRFREENLKTNIAFNVSGSELDNDQFFEMTLQTLEHYCVQPGELDLEITESQAMVHYEDIRADLRDLIHRGMAVSIDDFGTGYSSFSHITTLPATTLKIDRSFVSKLDQPEGLYVVDIMLALGSRFHYSIVAEGIETEEQRQILLQHGCDIGQGYLFSKPITLDDAVELLRSGRSLLPETT